MSFEVPNDRGSIARIHGAVALTAMARRIPNVRITLSPPRTTPMAFVVAEPPASLNQDDLISRIMLELAGGEAVRHLNGVEPGMPTGAVSLVEQLCTQCGDDRQAPEIIEQCRADVARLLAANWPMVELLGEVLLREGRLDGTTVHQIVGDTLVME